MTHRWRKKNPDMNDLLLPFVQLLCLGKGKKERRELHRLCAREDSGDLEVQWILGTLSVGCGVFV